MKADIGIIGAMESEVRSLISMLEAPSTKQISGVTFHYGSLLGKNTVIARCGVGKVFAAICTQTMILEFSPSLIVNTGVGGALASGISIGDVVIADRLCQHDMDTSAVGDPKGLVSGINKIYFDSDEKTVDLLSSAASALGIKTVVGTVASGDKFISSMEDKLRIRDDFGACCCEMEGAAVAHTCYVNNTRFAVIRAISDSADGEATMDYPTFLPIAAANSAKMTIELIKSV